MFIYNSKSKLPPLKLSSAFNEILKLLFFFRYQNNLATWSVCYLIRKVQIRHKNKIKTFLLHKKKEKKPRFSKIMFHDFISHIAFP